MLRLQCLPVCGDTFPGGLADAGLASYFTSAVATGCAADGQNGTANTQGVSPLDVGEITVNAIGTAAPMCVMNTIPDVTDPAGSVAPPVDEVPVPDVPPVTVRAASTQLCKALDTQMTAIESTAAARIVRLCAAKPCSVTARSVGFAGCCIALYQCSAC